MNQSHSHCIEALVRGGARESDARACATRIIAAYQEPQRFYHTLAHIEQMRQVINDLRAFAPNPAIVELATWLHDLVYDPTRSDNEEASARRAGEMLGALRLDAATITRVQALVLATKIHTAGEDRDAAVLIDADLAILAASEEQYQTYAAQIRQEYSYLSDEPYRAGRAAALKSFLNRTWIYQTDWMRERGEQAARRNLGREIAGLE